MLRQIAIMGLALFACVQARPMNPLADYETKEMIELKNSFTDDDKKVLLELMIKYKDAKDESAYMAELKEKAPRVHQYTAKIIEKAKAKKEALGPEALAFAEKIGPAALKIQKKIVFEGKIDENEIKEYMKKFKGEFNALSADAKKNIKENLPQAYALLEQGNAMEVPN